jgi:hypothetical protein
MKKSKYLIISLFTVTLVGSVIAFYFFTISLDKKYSQLIEHQVSISNSILTITNRSNQNFYSIQQLLHKTNIEDIGKNIQETKANVEANSKSIDSLVNIFQDNYNAKKELNTLINARKNYLADCDTFYAIKNGLIEKEDNLFFTEKLIHKFYIYQNSLYNFFNFQNHGLAKNSKSITSEYKAKSLTYLAFGLSPFLLTIIYITFLLMALLFLSINLKDAKLKDSFFN